MVWEERSDGLRVVEVVPSGVERLEDGVLGLLAEHRDVSHVARLDRGWVLVNGISQRIGCLGECATRRDERRVVCGGDHGRCPAEDRPA